MSAVPAERAADVAVLTFLRSRLRRVAPRCRDGAPDGGGYWHASSELDTPRIAAAAGLTAKRTRVTLARLHAAGLVVREGGARASWRAMSAHELRCVRLRREAAAVVLGCAALPGGALASEDDCAAVVRLGAQLLQAIGADPVIVDAVAAYDAAREAPEHVAGALWTGGAS